MNCDTLLEEARARHSAAVAEAERWARFIAMAEELGAATQPTKSAGRTPEQQSQSPKLRPATGVLADTERAVISALNKAGRTLLTRDLVRLVKEAGVEIGGQDEVATLSARLSRSTRLKNDRPFGWRVLDEIPKGTDTPDPLPSDESGVSLHKPPNLDESQTEVEHDVAEAV